MHHQESFRTLILLFFLFFALPSSYAQQELASLGHLDYESYVNDVWGYVDGQGNEYALLGTQSGFSIVDVSQPAEAKEVFYIDGEVTTWRDIKTYQQYAYVANEGGGGLLIVDLSELPEKIDTFSFINRGKINKSHNIYIDTEEGFLYVAGFTNIESNIVQNSRGVMIYDLNDDPIMPTFKGAYFDGYAHDVFVRDGTMYTSEIYNGWLGIVDVRNKSRPTLMARVETPLKFTHNAWLSDNGTYIYATDEKRGGYTAAYDISDLNDITEMDRYQSSPGGQVIPHNVHVFNDFLVISHYTDGVRIVDANEPDALTEVAFFNTTENDSIPSAGCWGAYPFLPSGNLLVTDRENGLFILDAQYPQAGYMEGLIIDSSTEQPIFGVSIEIANTNIKKQSNLFGNYKVGFPASGTYNIQLQKYSYDPKTIEDVVIEAGTIKTLDVTLTKQAAFPLEVQVINAENGAPINNATVEVSHAVADYKVSENDLGKYLILEEAYEDDYALLVSAWGYHAHQQSFALDPDNHQLIIELTPGYYDDFRSDLGWTVSGDAFSTGQWLRNRPIATYDNTGEITYPANPGADVEDDEGDLCFMTGNFPGEADNADLDLATSILSSPKFDLSEHPNAVISFYLWFYSSEMEDNTDNVTINILNGEDQVKVQRIDPYNAQMSQWLYYEFRPADYIPLTSEMRLTINAIATYPDFKVTEAAFDAFEIRAGINTTNDTPILSQYSLLATPSLFADYTILELQTSKYTDKKPIQLQVYDLQGQLIDVQNAFTNTPTSWGNAFPSGYYIVKMGSETEGFLSQKLVKY